MIVVLTGGTGGAKFVQGLARIAPQREITAIVNIGDDLRWWGLHISPDLDSITYALAGVLSPERGWGFAGDTFTCLERMRKLGADGWFQLGDRDLATHLRRTQLLEDGLTLTAATAEIAHAMGVTAQVLPMSDDRVETRVLTAQGELSFQEYFVRERYRIEPMGVRFEGAGQASPAPGVVDAICSASAVLIAPSNPITSIGPILSVPGIRHALQTTSAPVAAVSPIVGNAAVSGPAAELMRAQGYPSSPVEIAKIYADFLDVLLIEETDLTAAAHVGSANVIGARTIMRSDDDKASLARAALAAAEAVRSRAGA